MEGQNNLISQRNLSILLVEDTPADSFEIKEDILFYFPCTENIKIVKNFEEANEFTKTTFDAVICDICIPSSESQDIQEHPGLIFMKLYRQVFPKAKIIAWSILKEARIEKELAALNIDFVHKSQPTIEIIGLLRNCV